ncbi:glucosamine-6-phosphate deaminase [Bacillus sp. SD088]|uniref:glucosamine-6-phosphate deaminase n=1 Tax=Bacillus sp. SD088 TaxID=2782012 RepID=UPI001A97A11F|nr:glucosamine-6-phosphate deaminase [Bacillus sp. SD088]MBO0992127.1 glucosamine-6-phosphate deaminase [Bacillus sp. SD088]
MNIDILKQSEYDEKVAEIALTQIKNKPNSLLGFATGNTTVGFHKELAEKIMDNHVSVDDLSTVNLDEYIGVTSTNPASCYYRMHDQIFKRLNLRKEQIIFLKDISEQEDFKQICSQFEDKIAEKGGIDVQFIGIGLNGHIGFNEPGTAFGTTTHVIELDKKTRESKAHVFGGIHRVPKRGITMGMKTIMRAKKIILLAKGENKAEIVYKALYGPVTPELPASVLQLHPNLTVILDEGISLKA